MSEHTDVKNIIADGMKAYEAKLQEKEKQRKDKQKKWIINYIFFVLVAVLIVYIFPSGNKFDYSYELGKPWRYSDLTAPGDFPLMKTAEEKEQDYNSLLKLYYVPYFTHDMETAGQITKQFEASSKKLEEQYGEEYTLYIKSSLSKIVADGIISNEDKDKLDKIGVSKIKVKEAKRFFDKSDSCFVESELKTIHTIKSAYEEIIAKAPQNLNQKFLKEFDINTYLKPTLEFEARLSALQREDIKKLVSESKGMVLDGQKIINNGEIINKDSYLMLGSLKHEIENGNMGGAAKTQWIGLAICILCILTALAFYFMLFRDFYIDKQRMFFVLSMIFGMCALTAYITRLSTEFMELSIFVIPYAIVPITISTFFDTRTALFTHLTTVLICSLMATQSFEFLLLQILTGMICISTLKKFYQRSQLFKSVSIIACIYIVTYIGLVLTHSSGWDNNDKIAIVSFIVNAGLLLFSYPLIFIFEKVFNFTSDITLVELTNSNSPLLRQFSEVAPGSFQHSLQVSNLASDAADYIHCNALLARAGALYHDIGKMANAIYFTENQNGFNPHSKLTALESVKIITNHVTDGLSIARKNRLPKQIQDFILSHHGKNPVRYFYNTYCNEHPDEKVNIEDFSYKGKLPSTKEEAVVMICDAVEAASRSLSEYTDEKINLLIENLVGTLVKDGAFADSPITFKEIELIKNVLKEKLKNLYHTRIRYPELKKKDNEE